MARKMARVGSLALGAICIVSLSVAVTTPTAGARGAAHTVAATSACNSSATSGSARKGRLLGMVAPQVIGVCSRASTEPTTAPTTAPALTPHARSLITAPTTAATTAPSNPGGGALHAAKGFSGSPPLVYHGGPLMGTFATSGDVTVVPVYWDPTSSMSAGYKSVINGYVTNVAADDGKTTNVYSLNRQYGAVYDIHAGTPIVAIDAITNGCTPDSGAIYSDNTGYTTCVTDAQIQAELNTVLSGHGLPSDLAHSYMVLLPKGVESCNDSRNNAQHGACTVSNAGGTFCAYHSNTSGGAIYSDLPFPIYSSPTRFTCGSDASLGVNESPNGQLDADVMLSAFSHELNESITDPLGNAWFDRKGNENGDDCSSFYGALGGAFLGAQYNQTINGAHYLTQEEFSNQDYFASKKTGCVQRVDLPLASFKVTPRTPLSGRPLRFNAAKSKGSIVSYAWAFGDASSGKGRKATHSYAGRGTYAVTLTVTDKTGTQNSITVFVAVS